MSSLLVKKNIVNMETLSADTNEMVTWSHVGWSVAELVCHSHKRTELTAGGHKKKDKKRKEKKETTCWCRLVFFDLFSVPVP